VQSCGQADSASFFAEDSTVDREKDWSGSRSRGLRLTVGDARVESALRIRITTLTHVNVHHFEQDIAGLYQVEVTPVVTAGGRSSTRRRHADGHDAFLRRHT
jgi:hypothetical protein